MLCLFIDLPVSQIVCLLECVYMHQGGLSLNVPFIYHLAVVCTRTLRLGDKHTETFMDVLSWTCGPVGNDRIDLLITSASFKHTFQIQGDQSRFYHYSIPSMG